MDKKVDSVYLNPVTDLHFGRVAAPGSFGALGLAMVVLTSACAHVEPPPGGPEDRTPPSVVSISPEQEAVVASYDGPVIFRFDERISETGVQDAVIVSPRTSPVQISQGRSEIRVSLRNGWRPGVIYQVTLLPEVRDLFNNPLPEPIRLVFSTGPDIPETRIGGTVVDRITGRAAADVRVEAIRTADSLVYAIETGREGRFELARIPEGEYLVRAFQDVNADRELDLYESRDSVTATISEAEPLDLALSILEPDSTAAVIVSMVGGERSIRIEFDDHLDPVQEIGVEQVSVLHPVGGALPIARVAVGEMPVADTVGVATDTSRTSGAAPAAAAPPSPAEAGTLPDRILAVELADDTFLEPGVEYVVRVTGIRNINNIVGDAEATLEVDPATPDP